MKGKKKAMKRKEIMEAFSRSFFFRVFVLFAFLCRCQSKRGGRPRYDRERCLLLPEGRLFYSSPLFGGVHSAVGGYLRPGICPVEEQQLGFGARIVKESDGFAWFLALHEPMASSRWEPHPLKRVSDNLRRIHFGDDLRIEPFRLANWIDWNSKTVGSLPNLCNSPTRTSETVLEISPKRSQKILKVDE